nr:reverse transcriptase domain-containing protein [Tanacetum cinerariifolium]
MPWRTLKQMMTAKYCPRGEINKLEVELWNMKLKGTDITSYTLCFLELTLLCGKMFPEESVKIESYVGGLPEMIRGNVMSYEPKTMQKAIESANEQWIKNSLGLSTPEIVETKLLTPTLTTTTTGEPQWHIKEFLLTLSVELRVITREIARGWETGIKGIKIRLGMKMLWQEHMDWVLQEETQTPMS